MLLLVHMITRPLGEFARVVRQLAQGNWNARVNYRNQDELGEVARSLNNFSDKIRETVSALEESKGRLEAILGNMESGVLLVNSSGQLVLVNPAAEETLGILRQDILGKSQVEALQNYSLSSLISMVLNEWQVQSAEVSLFYPKSVFSKQPPPLFWGRGKVGVVVVLYDASRIRRLKSRAEL